VDPRPRVLPHFRFLPANNGGIIPGQSFSLTERALGTCPAKADHINLVCTDIIIPGNFLPAAPKLKDPNLHAPGAADMDVGPIHVPGFLGKQVTDIPDYVLRISGVAGRNVLKGTGEQFPGHTPGFNKTRGNRVRRNAVRCERLGQGPGQNNHSDLCDIMRGNKGLACHLVGVYHTEADDASPFPPDHARRGRTAQIKYRVEIAVEHGAPPFSAFLHQVDAMIGQLVPGTNYPNYKYHGQNLADHGRSDQHRFL
jgi:hypothetical protein